MGIRRSRLVSADQAGNEQCAPAPDLQQSFPVHAVSHLTLNATPEPVERGTTITAKARLRTASGPMTN